MNPETPRMPRATETKPSPARVRPTATRSLKLALSLTLLVSTSGLAPSGVVALADRVSVLPSMARLTSLGLPATDIRQIVSAVEPVAFDSPDSWDDELRARRVNLGTSQGLVLQGTNLLCGATGNCQLFVLRRTKGVWVSLFERDAPIGDGFHLGPHRTNGIMDFIVTSNLSAGARRRAVFTFDGRFYREQ